MAAAAGFIQMGMSILGKQQEGKQADEAAGIEAGQLEYRAGQTRAAAQRQALEERRQTRLQQSRLQAVAGTSDATVVNIAKDIAGEGEYRALTALYQGEQSALNDNLSAKGTRMQGKNARGNANIGSLATIFSSGSKMYSSFGGGGPSGGGGGAGSYGGGGMSSMPSNYGSA